MTDPFSHHLGTHNPFRNFVVVLDQKPSST